MLEITIPCNDTDEALVFFTGRLGFRLEMIFPADAPTIAVVSGHGVTIRLESTASSANLGVPTTEFDIDTSKSAPSDSASAHHATPIISRSDQSKWVAGRAGMEYRDLIPGRLGGRLIASHIRIADAGEVPDYVHYHKIDFQMIYCWRGKVRVVYEDQGEPFWLHPGDCVLQPPEIRHRVLEAAANTQVVELTSPAVHETWADHDLKLPTGRVDADRIFNGQHFVHHKAAESIPIPTESGGLAIHNFGIAEASNNAARVFELRTERDNSEFRSDDGNALSTFLFMLSGNVSLGVENLNTEKLTPGDAILIPPHTGYKLHASANSEILCVEI